MFGGSIYGFVYDLKTQRHSNKAKLERNREIQASIGGPNHKKINLGIFVNMVATYESEKPLVMHFLITKKDLRLKQDTTLYGCNFSNSTNITAMATARPQSKTNNFPLQKQFRLEFINRI